MWRRRSVRSEPGLFPTQPKTSSRKSWKKVSVAHNGSGAHSLVLLLHVQETKKRKDYVRKKIRIVIATYKIIPKRRRHTAHLLVEYRLVNLAILQDVATRDCLSPPTVGIRLALSQASVAARLNRSWRVSLTYLHRTRLPMFHALLTFAF